jgi:hypothetical protein
VLTRADVLAAPYALVRTVDEVTEELDRHRERWPSRRTRSAHARELSLVLGNRHRDSMWSK